MALKSHISVIITGLTVVQGSLFSVAFGIVRVRPARSPCLCIVTPLIRIRISGRGFVEKKLLRKALNYYIGQLRSVGQMSAILIKLVKSLNSVAIGIMQVKPARST